MTLKLGVLGLGKAGLRHVEAAEACEGVELVAVADTSEAVRARLGGGHRYDVVESLEDLMASGAEAVVVAVPHAFLAGSAIALLERGLHVLVEKPMANTLEDARLVVAAAEASGAALMVNYNHRFRDEYQTAKRWIDEGRVGRPRFIVEQMIAPSGPLPPWVWDPSVAGGGMMTYNGAHVLDHVMWLCGEPVEAVAATTASLHFDEPLEDTSAAWLRFRGGALGSVTQHKSNVTHAQASWETRVLGSEGAIRVVSGKGAHLSAGGGEESVPSGPERRFLRALQAFTAAVAGEGELAPDGARGLEVLACLKVLYRAATTGGWVAVD